MKQTKIKIVDIGKIRLDHTFQRNWGNVISSPFFAKAVEKFKHYTHPVVYEKNGYYYLLGHKPSLDALIELNEEEIAVELISITEADVILFLITFLSKEHKELRCTAELIRLILEYATYPEGKKWFKSVCGSNDQEERLSVILQISTHSSKCYLKLLQPGNEEYLKLLADLKNYSLTRAYNECVANEKKSKARETDAYTTPKDNNSQERSETPAPSGDFVTEESDDDDFFSFADEDDVRTVVKSKTAPTASTAIGEEGSDEDRRQVMLKQLDKYRRNIGSEPEPDRPASLPLNSLASKVIVVLYDASLLELNGEIELCVDGSTVNSTSQLQKLPDGNWSLHKQHKTLSLTINSKIAA